MPIRFLSHTFLLVVAVGGVYLWLSSPLLFPYTLQLVALLVLLYLATHWLRAHKPKLFHKNTVTMDVTLLTAMILLLVSETGALTSPLFFLLYFLMFGVAMLYDIEATLVLTGVLILYFLLLPTTNLSDLAHLSELLALVMVTPLAILTGHIYETDLEDRRARALLSQHISREETDTLMFLSLNLKDTLLSALDNLSVVIPQTKIRSLHTDLETLYQDLKTLYRSADELQQTLDHDSDSQNSRPS